MMNNPRGLYEALSDEEKQKFWTEFAGAMCWGGWDTIRTKGITCKSLEFFRWFERLCREKGVSVFHYT